MRGLINYRVIEEGANLISAVLEEINLSTIDLSKTIVIFAGKRPSYFLLNALNERIKQPFIPPLTFSIDEFIDYCYENELFRTDRKLDPLSCCKIIKDIFQDSIDQDLKELNSFIPYGLKLYSVFEELLIEDVTISNLKLKDIMLDGGITIDRINRLSDVYRDFYKRLEKEGYSTRSFRYKKVSEGDITLRSFDRIIFAGFFALTKCERRIFKRFYNDDRAIFIFLGESAKSYVLENNYNPPRIPVENITLYECPDSHCQVFKLSEILKKDYESKKENETFLIIAPSADIIIPLINIIERDFNDYNISVGYPLIKTPLYSFIKGLFDVLISKKDNKVYIPDYLNFVLHPYTKNITLNNNAEITRTIFHKIEDALTRERFKNYISIKEIENFNIYNNLYGELPPDTLKRHVETIHQNTINNFTSIKDIRDLSVRIKRLINYIYINSTAKKHILFFPFCEYMLHALTELENSLIADESFKNYQEYMDFLKRFISLYNVPFKGTPIKDIQVLGFLEARNLKFDNIYILDVNEGILPNNNREDSILPFDVRINLGLPTYRDKDRLFDYYLRCALLGANKSVLFYVEDDQKERSRFIERIIWEKQKKAKDIKRDFFIPLSYNFSLNPYRPKAVPKDDEIAGYLKTFVYSASSLDTYFECPLKFYYRYILLPAEEKNVYEELEDKDVGNIVHKILEGYFRDKSIDYECKKFNEIVDAVFRELFGDNLNGEGLVIKYQIKQRLSDFISQYKVITGSQSIEILGLEKNFETTVQIDGIGDIRLEGKVDRLERRDYEVFIVDYKTSSERRKYVTKWDKFEIDNRSDWKKAFKSIQMIFYMYLLEKDRECKLKPSNASILLVREKDIKKAEVRLFGETDKGYQKQVGLIIDAIISEIITAKEFTPADNLRICDRCKYKNMCWR